MNALGHLPVAAAASATVSFELGWPLWQRLAGLGLSVALAMVPDCDNTKPWQAFAEKFHRMTRLKALNHRRLTHSWMIPAALIHTDPTWAMVALMTGPGSHVGADAIFGEGGVPLFLWFGRFGLHLPMGGWLERITAFVLAIYAALALAIGPSGVVQLADAVVTMGRS